LIILFKVCGHLYPLAYGDQGRFVQTNLLTAGKRHELALRVWLTPGIVLDNYRAMCVWKLTVLMGTNLIPGSTSNDWKQARYDLNHR
jgi:hypothetical protein